MVSIRPEQPSGSGRRYASSPAATINDLQPVHTAHSIVEPATSKTQLPSVIDAQHAQLLCQSASVGNNARLPKSFNSTRPACHTSMAHCSIQYTTHIRIYIPPVTGHLSQATRHVPPAITHQAWAHGTAEGQLPSWHQCQVGTNAARYVGPTHAIARSPAQHICKTRLDCTQDPHSQPRIWLH